LILQPYRALLGDRRARRLLSGLGVSSLGDGMSTVTIAWLAVRTAPTGSVGLFVGLAVAAYALPGAVGALALGRHLRHRPAPQAGGPMSMAAGHGVRRVRSAVEPLEGFYGDRREQVDEVAVRVAEQERAAAQGIVAGS
jgi:hypothetical protein